jgi:hypothetical protein
MANKGYLVRRAKKFFSDSERSRWAVCLIAANVVGQYDAGEAIGIAAATSSSVSSVYNWADAGRMYRALREYASSLDRARQARRKGKDDGLGNPNSRHLRELRDAITYSHFSTLYRLWMKYGFSIQAAWDYIDEAGSERVSATMLRDKVIAENDQKPQPPLSLERNGDEPSASERMVASDNKRRNGARRAKVVEAYEGDRGETLYAFAFDDDGPDYIKLGTSILITVVDGGEG